MPQIKAILNDLDSKSRLKYNGYDEDKSFSLLDWASKKYDYLNDCIAKKNQLIFRDEIYWVDLGENLGSEESKLRPCVIIQNQLGNVKAPTTLVAPITNAVIKLLVAVELKRGDMPEITGTIDCGQIRVISKGRIKGKISKLSTSEKKAINLALLKSLGLYEYKINYDKSQDTVRKLNLENNKKDSLINELNKENEKLANEIEKLKVLINKE